MMYLVMSKLKSNHRKVVAAFLSRRLAEVYCLHKQAEIGSEYNKFFVQEVPLLDETPEMNKIMLSASRN